MRNYRILLSALVALLPGLFLGQDLTKVPADAAGDDRGAEDASVLTRPDARTMTLTIPAPRGLITDRNGKPLAENRVGYQFAIHE